MEHLMWDRWDLLPGSAQLGGEAGRRANTLRPTTGAGDDIWCTIGTRGKWDYGRGNGIDSLLDRFTDSHRIEYRRNGCKTHHLWGELRTVWNNLFGLGNPHTSLFWFTYLRRRPTPPPHLLTPTPPLGKGEQHGWRFKISPFHQFVKSPRWAVLGLWSVSLLTMEYHHTILIIVRHES